MDVGLFLGIDELGKLEVSSLQFADDTLVCCGFSKREARSLELLFSYFQLASGLRVNLRKTMLFPMWSDSDRVAEILGCVWVDPSYLPSNSDF